MGTPDFAVPTLQRLIGDGYDLVAVYTQPDRPSGRTGSPVASPVKRVAVEAGIPVRQPRSLRRGGEPEVLRELRPDLLVVAAYGLILPQEILDTPRFGGLNVHPSLLPRHRGPSPIPGALLAGDEETGVTIMLMDAGMDTGPVLTQVRTPIEPEENALALTDRLARLGASLLSETIPSWIEGRIEPQPQDEALATYTRLLTREDAVLDWMRPAAELVRQVRAHHPWPGSVTSWAGRRLEVLEAEAMDWPEGADRGAPPGTVLAAGKHGVGVATGEGLLALKRVRLEGRRALDVEQFVSGARGFLGSVLQGTVEPR